MNPDDLPDFLRLNGFSQRPGMFGAGMPSNTGAQPSAPFPPAPGTPPFVPLAGLPTAPQMPQPAFQPGSPIRDPNIAGALGMAQPPIDFAAPTPAPSAKPAKAPHYRVPPPEIITAAQDMQRRWGVPASVSLAQWAIESRWGAAMPDGSNNPFSVKAVGNQPSVTASTHEYVNGKRVAVPQAFRKYPSLDDAWESRSKMLATSPLYAKARPHLNDPNRFADAIAGTYAPNNPTYAQSIKDMMRINRLYQYNSLPGQPAAN